MSQLFDEIRFKVKRAGVDCDRREPVVLSVNRLRTDTFVGEALCLSKYSYGTAFRHIDQ